MSMLSMPLRGQAALVADRGKRAMDLVPIAGPNQLSVDVMAPVGAVDPTQRRVPTHSQRQGQIASGQDRPVSSLCAEAKPASAHRR